MKTHHTRTQLKTRTRAFYSTRVAEVCEIIDENYTALVINSSGFTNEGISFYKVVDKYKLSRTGECRVIEALGLIWGWYIGQYLIMRPRNVEEYR